MKSSEIYKQMLELWNEFNVEHEKFELKKNKSAGTRARKVIGEMKKLVTGYRQASVEDAKSIEK